MSIAYYNGFTGAPEEIRVPLTDRALYFGDGVYDAAVGRRGKIYLADEHIRRFYRNMERVGLLPPCGKEELLRLLGDLVKKSGEEEGFFLYMQASRSGERAHAYETDCGTNLLITVKPWRPEGERLLSLIGYEDLRYEYCNVKTLNLLPSVLAARAAAEASADEAVFLRRGTVTECSHSNVSILKGGCLITHPSDRHILSGIARKNLIALCARLGVPVIKRAFRESDLLGADEVLVTSTGKFCMRAGSYNGLPLPCRSPELSARLCRELLSEFMKATS